MNKVLVKQVKPSMVLVQKGVAAQYPLGAGGPILVAGGGGRGGGAPKGRTKRERVGSALGATAGALGALTGQHRSLGGLVQSAISGGAQGASLGGALGRKLSGRSSRALADVKEGEKQARATQHAEQGTGINRFTAPVDSYNRRVGVRHADELARVNQANAAATAPSLAAGQKFQQSAGKFQQARNAAQGTQWGRDDSTYATMGRQMHDVMGGDLQDLSQRANVAHAAQMGRQPNVDAAGKPVQVINTSMHPNMLPAPSPSAQEASAGTEINNIESASDREAMETGTDMKDSEQPLPLGDAVNWEEQQMAGMSPEQRAKILADMARGTNTVQGQASAMNAPTDDEKKYNQQSTLF